MQKEKTSIVCLSSDRYIGENQSKSENNLVYCINVYTFLLFVSSRPHYQAGFQYIESGLCLETALNLYTRRTPIIILGMLWTFQVDLNEVIV